MSSLDQAEIGRAAVVSNGSNPPKIISLSVIFSYGNLQPIHMISISGHFIHFLSKIYQNVLGIYMIS